MRPDYGVVLWKKIKPFSLGSAEQLGSTGLRKGLIASVTMAYSATWVREDLSLRVLCSHFLDALFSDRARP